MHHYAKFRQNRSMCCGDIAIILFFKMAAVRHVGCVWTYLDHARKVLGGLYHCAKFGYIPCISFDNMNVYIVGASGWKKPIHAPKMVFLGYLTH